MDKARERLHLDRFIEIHGDSFPEGEIISDENPDFFVSSTESKIGIELTEILIHEERIAENEGIEREILNTAGEIWDENGNPTSYVSVRFEPGFHVKKKDRRAYAERLVELLETHPDKDSDPWIDGEDTNIEGLRFIAPTKRPHMEKSNWDSANISNYGKTIDASFVQERIDIKNERYSDYREKCDEVWLIIVIDGHSKDSDIDVGSEVLRATFKTDFDRIYIFDRLRRSIIQLDLD